MFLTFFPHKYKVIFNKKKRGIRSMHQDRQETGLIFTMKTELILILISKQSLSR